MSNEMQSPEQPSVVLRGQLVPISSDIGCLFAIDLCRIDEAIMTLDELTQKWGLTDDQMADLATNAEVIKAVSAEKERRIFSGTATREAAAFQLAKAPGAAAVLGRMLHDKLEASRAKIDASKELRAMAAGGSDQPAATGEKYTITIITAIPGEKDGPPPIVVEIPPKPPALDLPKEERAGGKWE